MDVFRSLFNEKTKLVSLSHISNVLGTVNPVKEIISISHSHDVPVLLDGAQAAPHTRIDVQDLDVDFYVLSAHKMYGPTGIGVLYGKEKWLNVMPPYQGGGEMISHVSFEKTTFNELPYKFEAGTPDYIGTMAFATALDYIENIGIENIAAHEQNLLHYTTGQLMQIDGMRIFGTAHEKSAVISFLKPFHFFERYKVMWQLCCKSTKKNWFVRMFDTIRLSPLPKLAAGSQEWSA